MIQPDLVRHPKNSGQWRYKQIVDEYKIHNALRRKGFPPDNDVIVHKVHTTLCAVTADAFLEPDHFYGMVCRRNCG